jgi:hypothetical protein
MYGSKVWTLSQGAANKIDSFEWKILQRYKDVALSTYIRLNRLMWVGYVVRME